MAHFAEILEHLAAETVGNIQMSNTNARSSSQEINSILGRVSAKTFDELGMIESRANSGIAATPLAPPVTGNG